MKSKVQSFGKFLSAMVMPNIGALIAFGFLAALFIDTGWAPNPRLNSMVGPMLTYLIPILIASTGGKMIGGDRGRVVASIAVIGAIMSNTEITMLMAAMVADGSHIIIILHPYEHFLYSAYHLPDGIHGRNLHLRRFHC